MNGASPAVPVWIVPDADLKVNGGDWYVEGRAAIPISGSVVPPAGSVTAAMMDSEAATNGQVLTADGAGGASWEDGGVSYPLLAPNGTIGAPSYSFTNDTDTGIRLSAVGTLAGTVGGADRFTVSTTAFNSTVPFVAGLGDAFKVDNSRYFGTSAGDNVFMTSNGGGENTWVQGGGASYAMSGNMIGWSSSANNPSVPPDTAFIRQSAGITTLTNGAAGGAALGFREQVGVAGVTDVGIIYADVLAGKTRLMVQFQTGAAIPLAVEL